MGGDISRANGRLGGRPKGSESESTKIRRAMQQRWLDLAFLHADKVFQAHFDLALGCYEVEITTEGSKRLYKRPPNTQSLQWIMEHVWGKAKQPMELDEGVEEPLMLSEEEFERISQDMERALGKAEGI